jgi:hypothetical protein
VKINIHTAAVTASITAASPNLFLGYKPPEIDSSELSLPRHYQTTVDQLRSGKCNKLRSYQHFIDSTLNIDYPECHIVPHTTAHLFCCPSIPTLLNVLDLWLQPVKVVDFI